jgi:NADH:ubiquinone oxidoreductase subunit 5 (subunit L)/multisubunit Na+/H+ antiporter MnhA subunit
MIYQGIIELSKEGSYVWIIWLLAAMFGSALTIASFMKLVQAIFFGDSLTEKTKGAKEVSPLMWLPTLILAALCLVFGVFAARLPIKYYLVPYLGTIPLYGFFAPQWALILLVTGLLCGVVFYLIANLKTLRIAPVFTGGEELSPEETKVSATHFYDPIKNLPLLKGIYREAEENRFDLYEQGSKATFWFSDILKSIHQGFLHTYLAWCLIGLVILMVLLCK